ncbi:MAG TPA: carboxypeptidase-like regulatory domain-containing protein, partial [Planctomycetota bacterium]|nr:carboxypeptidase-like regulatory domain-containing protein [Planctomycetota bacterium]
MTTGVDGWIEFEVESGKAYWVQVGNPTLGFDGDQQKVSALAPGERREIELLVPTKEDVVLFGRLLDAETSKPVVDGRVLVEGGWNTESPGSADPQELGTEAGQVVPEDASIHADVNGRFELHGKSWEHRIVGATAPAYARTVFRLGLGYSDSTHPLEVRMSRSATVDARVKDASGSPIADVTVDLTTDPRRLQQNSSMLDAHSSIAPSWSATTDARGEVSIAELPPNAPLKVTLRKQGLSPRNQADPLVLSPGERRSIEIAWEAGGVLQGRVLDGKGEPVSNQLLWRLASERPNPMPTMFERYQQPMATTRTDSQGQFRFEDVATGDWLVGIAPDESSEFPPYAEPVAVRTEGEVVELILRVDARLFVRGMVTDPAGQPIPASFVGGHLENSWIWIQAETDASGNFELGPLPRGDWILEARGRGEKYAASLPARAAAGAEGVDLQLRLGASIAGRVVDGTTLASAECRLILSRPDLPDGNWVMTSSRDGAIHFVGLLPGSYLVSARDGGGSIGMSRLIRVAEGEAVEGVEIKLERGAKLRLRYAGEVKRGGYVLFAAGLPINFNRLESGMSAEETVPAGTIDVRWSTPMSPLTKTQTLTIAVGEERELVWDGKP